MDDINVTYPVPGFRFTVCLDGEEIRCRSVSGLPSNDVGMGGYLGYTDQNTAQAQALLITLSQAVVSSEGKLYQWIFMSEDNKKDISISLTDESENILYVTWEVFNVFVVNVTGIALDPLTSNNVAFAHIVLNGDRVRTLIHSSG